MSVPLSNSVKYLGVVFDNTLSMKKIHHQDLSVLLLSITAHKRDSQVSVHDATSKLVTSLILSCFDYCNSFWMAYQHHLSTLFNAYTTLQLDWS